jgi:tetratricopeptide (TPR) repeat protein
MSRWLSSMLKRSLFLFLFLFSGFSMFSQHPKFDSLYKATMARQDNLAKLAWMVSLENYCAAQDLFKHATMSVSFADKLLRKNTEKRDSVLYYQSISYNNIGFYYQEHGKTSKALEFLIQGLKLQESIKDSVALLSNITNLGTIVRSIGDTARAFTYYKRAEEVATRKNNLNMIANLKLKLGAIYVNKNKFDTAIAYYNQSLDLYKKLNKKKEWSQVHRYIGIAYQNQGKIPEAISEYQQALDISTEVKDLKEMSFSYEELGAIHFYRLQEWKKALEYLKKGLEAATQGGYFDRRTSIMQTMAYSYAKLKDFDKAFKYHYRYVTLNDSLEKLMEKKKSFKMNLEYEFDKKFAADSLKNIAEQRILDAQLDSHKKELKQEKTIKYTLILIAILILFLAYFIFSRLRHSREQNRIISEQKHQVEEQKELIEKQKEDVEEKQKEILDSIRYAKRIQQSLLPNDKYMNKHLKK